MMLLGKRGRPPIRRTTSMTGITVDLSHVEQPEESDYQNPFRDQQLDDHHRQEGVGRQNNMIIEKGFDQYYSNTNILSAVSPRNHRRNSADHTIETAHFLRTCGLCKRRLSSGRDIYMYRGDAAFCSQECREQQMKQDERQERNCILLPSSNDDRHAATSEA